MFRFKENTSLSAGPGEIIPQLDGQVCALQNRG